VARCAGHGPSTGTLDIFPEQLPAAPLLGALHDILPLLQDEIERELVVRYVEADRDEFAAVVGFGQLLLDGVRECLEALLPETLEMTHGNILAEHPSQCVLHTLLNFDVGVTQRCEIVRRRVRLVVVHRCPATPAAAPPRSGGTDSSSSGVKDASAAVAIEWRFRVSHWWRLIVTRGRGDGGVGDVAAFV